MNRKVTKIIALLVAIMIFSGTFSVWTFIYPYAETTDYLFFDDFNSYGNNASGVENKNAMNQKGWNVPNNTTGNYNTGSAYSVKSGASVNILTSNVSGSAQWKDYSVSSKIKCNSDISGNSYVYLVGRENAGSGYWCRIWFKDGVLRSIELETFKNNTKADVLNTYSFKTSERIAYNTEFTVKLEFAGATINGYLNNQRFVTATDALYQSGCAGIHTASSSVSAVTFDDFAVEKGKSQPDFKDDFADQSTMTSNGWSSNSSGSKDEGKYTLNASESVYLTGLNGSNEWKNYTVEADVSLASGNITQTESARLVAYSSNTSNSGYEFGISLSNDGNNAFVLYKKGTVDGKINDTEYKYTANLQQNKFYHLRITVSGGRIICSADNETVFDVNDTSALQSGYIGLISAGDSINAVFDNVLVRATKEEDFIHEYPSDYFYKDNFDKLFSMKSRGWASEKGVLDCENGIISFNPNETLYLSGIKGSEKWDNYVVEGRLSLISNSCTSSAIARIVARSTASTGNGYEYGITYDPTNNKVSLQLYKRGESGGKIGGTAYSMTLNNGQFDYHTYKMVLFDNRIICYFDGLAVFDVADEGTDNIPAYDKGYVGLRSIGTATGFVVDYFNVRKVTDEDKEIKDKDYGESCYYSDGFDSIGSMTILGWSADVGNRNIAEGKYEMPVESSIYLTGIKDSDKWDKYVVEATLQLNNKTSETASYARIVAKSTNKANNGYEYGLAYDPVENSTYLQLYKRSSSGGKINGTAYTMKLNGDSFDVHNYKMIVKENRIICYFDDIPVFDVTDNDAPFTAGYAGIRSVGNKETSVGFDVLSYSVRKATDSDFIIVKKEYPKSFYYSDEFEDTASMTLLGWSSDPGELNLEDGVYILPENYAIYLSEIEELSELGEYVVESRMKLENEDSTTLSSARIVARSNNKAEDGYEYGLTYNPETNEIYLQLYKRGIIGGKINNTAFRYDIEVNPFEYHDFKLIVKGNRIICVFDNNAIFDVVDDEAVLTGYTGLRAVGTEKTSSPVVIDNYFVRDISEDDLKIYESLFNIDGYYYKDDFNIFAPLTAIGWNSDFGKRNTEKGLYEMQPNKASFFNGTDYFDLNNNYAVECKLALNEGELSEYASARLVARTDNTTKSGYEFGCHIDKETNTSKLILYKRGESGGKINSKTYSLNMAVSLGEYHSYKIVVFGNRILCYFDGMKVFDVVDKGTEKIPSYDKGYAGIKMVADEKNTIGLTLDYFYIKNFDNSDIVEDKVIKNISDDLWFYDDFSDETSLTERGWSSDIPGFKDGMVITSGPLYLTDVENSRYWTDYEVSADVFVDIESGFINDATTGSSRICLRSNGENSGYEFGILTPINGSAYLALFDRKNKQYISTNKSFDIDEGVHNLRALCSGDVIECYFDDQLVFNEKSEVMKAGFAGVRASGINTYYDNFVVSKLGKYYDFSNKTNGNANKSEKSPLTLQIVDFIRIISLSVFILSSLGLVFYISYFKNKKEV